MTTARFSPVAGPLDAVIEVPGSKSVANRALICAMLADGESVLRGVPDGDDTQVILNVLTELSSLTSVNDSFIVKGNPHVVLPGIIDAGLAGTSSRFLSAVAAISDSVAVIDGGEPLRGRPMADLHDALQQLGAVVDPLGQVGHLPVSISGRVRTGGELTIRANVSSQFISALMLIGPMLSGGLTLRLEGSQVSSSYIEMTARVMSAFGANVTVGKDIIVITEGRYLAREYTVEPDFSSAAFPIVAVLLRGGCVRIPHLESALSQGDAAILKIATELGASVTFDNGAVVVVAASNLFVDKISLQMSDCSDLVPVVAVALTRCAKYATIDGVGFIRFKESDRLGDLAQELTTVGALVAVTDDGLIIEGGNTLRGAQLATHHDHRLAMSFALLSLVNEDIVIEDPSVVRKSWPQYFSDMFDILGPATVEN